MTATASPITNLTVVCSTIYSGADQRNINMTASFFWRETVVVVLDGGMCKATTPGVKQSRASQWTARATRRLGASIDMVYYDYA